MFRNNRVSSGSRYGMLLALLLSPGWLCGCSGDEPAQPDSEAAEAPAASVPAEVAGETEAASADETTEAAQTTGTPADDSSTPASEAADSDDARWGHLTGRFVYDAQRPTPEKLELTKDIEFCSQNHPVDQSLLVDANGGLANVVLWLDVRRADEIPEIHESYSDAPEPLVLNNSACLFEPHVSLLRTDQTLLITNDDAVDHNTQAFLDRNTPFNEVIPKDGSIEKTLARPERKPVKISCSIHRWMDAWLIVKDHPYVSVSGTDGSFVIENLPLGKWTFRAWHELPEYVETGSRDGETFDWPQGKLTLTIEPGTNDLGEVRLQPDLFTD